MEKEFCLEEYLNKNVGTEVETHQDNMEKFTAVCRIVEMEFNKEWNETDDEAKNRKLEREKRAIMGFEEETVFYKEKIKEILQDKKLSESWFPHGFPICPKAFLRKFTAFPVLLPGLTTWKKSTGNHHRQN